MRVRAGQKPDIPSTEQDRPSGAAPYHRPHDPDGSSGLRGPRSCHSEAPPKIELPIPHHGSYERSVFSSWFGRRFPIRVLARYAWSHSLGFGDPGPAYSARAKRAGIPFIIHAAEGTDQRSREEVDQLDQLGLLSPHTILIHGIALTSSQRQRVAESGAGLVWCPSSNVWLYGATAPVDALPEGIPLGLGTDSTRSGEPTLLAELRAADGTGLLSRQATAPRNDRGRRPVRLHRRARHAATRCSRRPTAAA